MPGNPSQMTVPSAETDTSTEDGEAGDNGDGD
jgi:hypothetical protein